MQRLFVLHIFVLHILRGFLFFVVYFLLLLFLFARVCLRIGSNGKQKREYLPEFVYVLGGFGNKRGRDEDVRAAIRVNDLPEFVPILGRMVNKRGGEG